MCVKRCELRYLPMSSSEARQIAEELRGPVPDLGPDSTEVPNETREAVSSDDGCPRREDEF